MRLTVPTIGSILNVWAAIFLSFSFAFAAEPVERKGLTPVGEIVFVAGKAHVKPVPEESYRSAVSRQVLVSNDTVKTAASARLSILFIDETQVKLASNTTLIIKEVVPNKEKPGALKILLKLESGEVWTRSKSVPEGLMIETPYATAAIRGTEWTLSVKENESTVSVMEGSVQLSNPYGSITVGRNEQAVVTGQEVPLKSILIRPRDRTQWTYYLSERRLLGHLKFTGQDLGKAEALFNEGNFAESARSFEQMRLTEPENPVGLTVLGMVELKAGDSEKAERYLDQSLKIQKTSLALLGKAYLFISRNQTVEANDILDVARESFPEDPLPYIFSSYLNTFYDDFHGALRECDQGLSAIRNDPLLLAFKADLYFILDEPEAKRTIDLLLLENPQSSESYERLGFYSGLDFFSLPEWSLYYAQKAVFITPYRNQSHIAVARAYSQLGNVSSLEGFNEFSNPAQSEQIIGLALDANVVSPNRYKTLIDKPGHYFTPGILSAFGDSTEAQADFTASGNFGSRFPLTYQLIVSAYRDNGYLQNSEYKSGYIDMLLGYKPRYDQDIYLYTNYNGDRGEITPVLSRSLGEPDLNQDSRDSTSIIEAGYHLRFSPISHLMAIVRYVNRVGRIENPDFKSDSTYFSTEGSGLHNFAAGIRQLVTLYESHQFTQGIDYNYTDVTSEDDWPVYPIGVVQRSGHGRSHPGARKGCLGSGY